MTSLLSLSLILYCSFRCSVQRSRHLHRMSGIDNYKVDFIVRGYHVYRDIWEAAVGQTLPWQRETSNAHDPDSGINAWMWQVVSRCLIQYIYHSIRTHRQSSIVSNFRRFEDWSRTFAEIERRGWLWIICHCCSNCPCLRCYSCWSHFSARWYACTSSKSFEEGHIQLFSILTVL